MLVFDRIQARSRPAPMRRARSSPHPAQVSAAALTPSRA